jgi:hypothetical protein
MIYNTVSSMFRKAARQLRDKGVMTYEQKKADRPAEIRLYSLRKWFRKQAIQAGFENVEFWMGHTGPGVDEAYRLKDPEFYRKTYAEKAMPFLRLESSTPTETEKQIDELRSENVALKEKLNQLAASAVDIQQLQAQVKRLEGAVTALASRPSLKFDEKAIEELLKGEGSSAMTRLRKRHPEWFSEE